MTLLAAFMMAFLQGIGWTAGWLLTMFVMLAWSEMRDWVFDKLLRKNGLK